MNDELLNEHITAIIDHAQALLNERHGCLSDKQREVIKTMIAAAERFIHVYAACKVMTIEDFFANMRHEVGNPLTPIRGYSELMMMGVMGALNDQQQAHVRGIFENTTALREEVDAMVSRARKLVAAKQTA